jgi:uncharacterized membrane protein
MRTQSTGVLQKHMLGTYRSLSRSIAVIGIALPVLLWVGDLVLDHTALRESMSAYYYSGMRNVFVGALFSIGVFLYLYKGFSTKENWALNTAGALAVGVALLPTSPAIGTRTSTSPLHAILAVCFFLCIAYVCVFRASDTLLLIKDARKAGQFRSTYRTLGLLMVVSPAIAVGLTFLFESSTQKHDLLFFVEAMAVWIFGAYWIVKGRELGATGAYRLALEGKLKAATKDTLQYPTSTDDIVSPAE